MFVSLFVLYVCVLRDLYLSRWSSRSDWSGWLGRSLLPVTCFLWTTARWSLWRHRPSAAGRGRHLLRVCEEYSPSLSSTCHHHVTNCCSRLLATTLSDLRLAGAITFYVVWKSYSSCSFYFFYLLASLLIVSLLVGFFFLSCIVYVRFLVVYWSFVFVLFIAFGLSVFCLFLYSL